MDTPQWISNNPNITSIYYFGITKRQQRNNLFTHADLLNHNALRFGDEEKTIQCLNQMIKRNVVEQVHGAIDRWRITPFGVKMGPSVGKYSMPWMVTQINGSTRFSSLV